MITIKKSFRNDITLLACLEDDVAFYYNSFGLSLLQQRNNYEKQQLELVWWRIILFKIINYND